MSSAAVVTGALRVRIYSSVQQVEIHFRISWRKSFSGRTQCNNDVIAAGTYIGPAGSYLDCFYGCHGQITSMDYKCTDFSIQEDWSAGEKSYKYTFPEDIHHYYQLNHYYQFGYGLLFLFLLFSLVIYCTLTKSVMNCFLYNNCMLYIYI